MVWICASPNFIKLILSFVKKPTLRLLPVIVGECTGVELFSESRGDVVPVVLTGEGALLGDSDRRWIVDKIVFLDACFARSMITKLDTTFSRFPFRFAEASNRGSTSGAMLGLWEM